MADQITLVQESGNGEKQVAKISLTGRDFPEENTYVVGLWHGAEGPIVGHTETTTGKKNPKFSTSFLVDHFTEDELALKWCVYEVKENNAVKAADFLGKISTTLKEIMDSKGGSKEFSLECKGEPVATKLRLSASDPNKVKPKKEPKEQAPAPTKVDKEKEKAIKAALKEGGKKGQDLCGMSTFGVHFFCAAMETPQGDMEMMRYVMEGMNKEVDPEAEERKGGAGDLGKLLLSASDDKLIMMCHFPKEVQNHGATLQEWMEAVCAPSKAPFTVESEFMAIAEIAGNPDEGLFPLKMRDEAIAAGFAFLREKGLVLDDDSDDDINFADDAGIDLNAGAEGDY